MSEKASEDGNLGLVRLLLTTVTLPGLAVASWVILFHPGWFGIETVKDEYKMILAAILCGTTIGTVIAAVRGAGRGYFAARQQEADAEALRARKHRFKTLTQSLTDDQRQALFIVHKEGGRLHTRFTPLVVTNEFLESIPRLRQLGLVDVIDEEPFHDVSIRDYDAMLSIMDDVTESEAQKILAKAERRAARRAKALPQAAKK